MDDLCERIKDYLLPVSICGEQKTFNSCLLTTTSASQVYLNNNDVCILNPKGYIIFDFGKEIQGGIRLLTARGSSKVRVRFGESLGEACSGLGEKNSTNSHSTRDFAYFIPELADMELGQTGFRFVRIDNIGNGDLRFIAVNAVYQHLKVLPKGNFVSNDKRINEIYDTAKRTLFLCMQNRVWDGIKRDRLVWIGDFHPELKGILYLYGNHPFIKSALEESMIHCEKDGWMCNIPSYSSWWLVSLCDYFLYSNDWDFFSSQLNNAFGIVSALNKSVDENGNVDYINTNSADPLFIAWETKGANNIELAHKGLILFALKKLSSVLTGRNEFNPEISELINKLGKNKDYYGNNKQVASVYSLGYPIDDNARKCLLSGGAERFNTFMSSYIADAIYRAGDPRKALFDMKEFYGGMLDCGATSFWESFNPAWLKSNTRIDQMPEKGKKYIHCSYGTNCYRGYRLSLCHGWSCGPVQFLSDKALGVKFLNAGGSKIKIEPDLMGLESAEGVIPTIYGDIEISNKMTKTGIKTVYKLPKDITVLK